MCEEGQVLGVVTVRDVQALPTALWPWRRVREIMRPMSPTLCIPPDWSIMQAMERMAQSGLDRLVVMENGEIVGLITRSAIAQYVQLHQSVKGFPTLSAHSFARATEMFCAMAIRTRCTTSRNP